MASLVRKLLPLGDRILIKRVQATAKTAGGVYLPDTASKKESEGEVVAVGAGGRTNDGKIIPLHCKVGDKVLLPEYGGSKIKLDEDEYFLYRDDDILAKFQ